VYIVNWSEKDPVVTRKDLEEMELLLNEEMGTLMFYLRRRSQTEDERSKKTGRREND